MRVWTHLSRIAIEGERLYDKGRTWRVHGFDFRLLDADVDRHGEELEEALWAIKAGLSS